MEEILKFENREQLFGFLIKQFGGTVIEERYDAKAFGNFFITLLVGDIFLRYVNDRGFLTIEIASKLDPEKWYNLSFVQGLLYNKTRINSDTRNLNNEQRIEELNDFL